MKATGKQGRHAHAHAHAYARAHDDGPSAHGRYGGRNADQWAAIQSPLRKWKSRILWDEQWIQHGKQHGRWILTPRDGTTT